MVNHIKLRFMVEYQKKLSLKISEKYKNGLFLVKIRSISYIFQRVNEVRENKSCFASQINIFNFGFTMRLSTFKIAVKSLLKITLTGVFLLNSGSASSKNHIQGLYDIDGDGLQESLVLNAGGFSAILVEFSETSVEDTVWQYNLPDQQKFNDAEIIDLDGDGQYELVATSDPLFSDKHQDWLFVFKGDGSTFNNKPISIGNEFLNIELTHPGNLTIVPGGLSKLAVSFGTPVRSGMVFNIDLGDNAISLSSIQMLSAPIIQTGYGRLYIGGFTGQSGDYLALVSPEGDQLKSAVFQVDNNFELSYSNNFNVSDARYIIGPSIQASTSTRITESGLIIPYATDDIFLLQVAENQITLAKTNLSGKGAFPFNTKVVETKTFDIIEKRIKTEIYPTQPVLADYLKIEQEKNEIPPPPPPLLDASESLKTSAIPDDARTINEREELNVFYKRKEKQKKRLVALDTLHPTLGDYLSTIKDEKKSIINNDEKVDVPEFNKEMESEEWAEEAGFVKVDISNYSIDTNNTLDSLGPSIPSVDEGVSLFTDEVRASMKPKIVVMDSNKLLDTNNEIDLYYVLAMTPINNQKRDRYIFDGEAPFGVSVDQIPKTGEATHFQHGVSANLANLNRGDSYDFAYSLRDARLDSITTLTMVHDMQTNVVFMSVSPQQDSLSQSYQPEAFDPKLFEFPDYFFEGFPTSLDMDFTDKLIRFSFDGEADSVFKGIYLSSTTPSIPSQSLAVFLDEGKLQAVRGEVVVRANGSKKITTEFDLTGFVEPSVMFSRLIQESFPDDLKTKLLQGATLVEPLFGPSGKLPKISRQPRLPEAQPEQDEPDIPVEPKQSIVPGVQDDSFKPSIENNNIIEKDLEDQPIMEDVLQDTLLLESVKNVTQDISKNQLLDGNEKQLETLPDSSLKSIDPQTDSPETQSIEEPDSKKQLENLPDSSLKAIDSQTDSTKASGDEESGDKL